MAAHDLTGTSPNWFPLVNNGRVLPLTPTISTSASGYQTCAEQIAVQLTKWLRPEDAGGIVPFPTAFRLSTPARRSSGVNGPAFRCWLEVQVGPGLPFGDTFYLSHRDFGSATIQTDASTKIDYMELSELTELLRRIGTGALNRWGY